MFLAAPAHDLDHRGRSNVLEINEETDIAKEFPNEKGPLENHHARLALETLDNTAILEHLSEGSRRIVRACVKNAILATDMGRHGAIMKGFSEAIAALEDEEGSLRAADFFIPGENGWLLLGMLLKSCDISNPARPIEIADKWNALVYDEFYAEGDVDLERGRPVNPLHNREKNVIPKSTVGFIGFVVAPIFTLLQRFTIAAASIHANSAKPIEASPQNMAKMRRAKELKATRNKYGDALGGGARGLQIFVDALSENKAVHAMRGEALDTGPQSPTGNRQSPLGSLKDAGVMVKSQIKRQA